eukprot:g17719.t1
MMTRRASVKRPRPQRAWRTSSGNRRWRRASRIPARYPGSDGMGRPLVSKEGMSESNCPFRSWQEDNGVTGAFASATVEKGVDGQKRMVSVEIAPSRLAGNLIRADRPCSADAAGPAVGNLSEQLVPDVKSMCALGRCSTEDLASGDAVGTHRPLTEEGAADRSSSRSADVVSHKVVASPQGLSVEEEQDQEAVSHCGPGKGMVGKDSASPEEGATGQSSTPAEEVDSQNVSATTPQGVSAEGAVSTSAPDCGAQPT